MPTIAIAGANGRLAYEAVLAFHQRGFHVIALTRSGQLRDCPAL